MKAPLDRRPVTRRQFLQASAAASAGVAGIVAARRAPAFAQGSRLTLLQWSHFIPAADVLFDTQAREFGKRASSCPSGRAA